MQACAAGRQGGAQLPTRRAASRATAPAALRQPARPLWRCQRTCRVRCTACCGTIRSVSSVIMPSRPMLVPACSRARAAAGSAAEQKSSGWQAWHAACSGQPSRHCLEPGPAPHMARRCATQCPSPPCAPLRAQARTHGLEQVRVALRRELCQRAVCQHHLESHHLRLGE